MSAPQPRAESEPLLIANRGEIALRIIRSARTLGLRTVAVYSDADRGAPHTRAADLAVHIGGAEARESYLNIPALLAAAARSGARAVHPGYGFLSENADFAAAVAAAGLTFIGPSAEVIAQMGDKAAAKHLARAAGVPCLEGHDDATQDDAAFRAAAARIGYPVMVKAAAGGGGRGMRLVANAAGLADALSQARAEALAAFGSGQLLLERAVERPRHVEIQLLADQHGQVLHLGERDCSLQRRHQKLVEEGPALPPALRAEMGSAAISLARAVGYVGAGTVEFLLGPDGRFVFIEMNTRLQVEHAVTEALTGLDLVEWQLRIAAGEKLPFTQADIRFNGHAIEARLCAEEPGLGFVPQHGHVARWRAPEGVRVDHALHDGARVPRHYDTMLAKLVAHAPTREEARRKLALALESTVLQGVASNRGFLAACLRHPDFVAGPVDTGFLARNPPANTEPSALAVALAALALAGIGPSTPPGPRPAAMPRLVRLALGRCAITAQGEAWLVQWGAKALTLRLLAEHDGALLVEADGLIRRAWVLREAGAVCIALDSGDYRLAEASRGGLTGTAAEASDLVRAPFTGMLAQLLVAIGERVTRGQTLLVLEAMKVQLKVTAPRDGVVAALPAAGRHQVAAGETLVQLAPESQADLGGQASPS